MDPNYFQSNVIVWFCTVLLLALSNTLSSLPSGEPYCSVQFYIVLVTWDLHKYTLKVRKGLMSPPLLSIHPPHFLTSFLFPEILPVE